MKILFLHLSDAHFKENTNLYDLNINALVNSLTQLGEVDECVLVFSGDIVQSGEENQYKVAVKFIGRLINGIKNKYLPEKTIQTLIVPGNHDNLAANPERDLNELKGYYSSQAETEDKFYGELSQLNNFYTFAQRNYCYSKGKIVDVKKLTFGKFTIKVNLINSAPFSLLCENNEDKGLHYLPQREIDKLDFDRQENYTISVIHHGPEWFSDNSKHALYNRLYETSDLIFVGHEHFSLSENKTVNGKHKVDVSSGVALYGTDKEQGFNALILDTEQLCLYGKKYIYNGKIYKPTPNLKNDNLVFRGKYKFTHTPEYKKYLETDIGQRVGEKYLEYFVFPALEAKNMNSELNALSISSEEKFMEIFKTNSKIFIEGGLNSGKTTLSKYLCIKLSEEYVPLLLTEEDFGSKNNKNVIKYALEEQYGEEADYDEFIQLGREKLVLIVDRSDRIKTERWESFYEEYESQFGHIILLCGIEWNINIKEKALEDLTENKFLDLKISPFYYGKREELINKICGSFIETGTTNVAETVRKINDEITNQVKYFQLNPDFIHQYVNYYLNFSFIKTQNDNNVFSKVFEANITFRIAKNADEKNVNDILVALDFVAHYAHFNKCASLTVEEFENAVEEYNKSYDNDLNPKMVYDVAQKANIIKESANRIGVEFCDENLLAYFTALHLNRSFNRGECVEELEYILNNICFGINGDIILFLSYITSNVQILNPIMKSMVHLMDQWEEFNFEEKNIEFLTKQTVPYQKPKAPDKEDKEKNVQKKNDVEKSVMEDKQRKSESLYSYDETQVNSVTNKISKSLSYLELVAKILPNFRHILDGPEKKAVVSILYSYPNKLLYFMLKDIDSNMNQIVKDILDKNPKTKRGMLITEDMLVKSLQAQATAYILSIYDFVACTASTGRGMDELNKFAFDKNLNYMIQNIMMEENNGNFNNFSKKAEKLYDKTDMNIIKNMVGMVVRKYFLNHDVALVGNAQKLADKFFGESERKNLQLAQAKNRIVKK